MARTPRTPKNAHEAQLVAIESLKPFPGNARTHDLDVIRESLRVNTQYRPIVVRTSTRHVLAGNGTLEAAKAEGWSEVWATFIDCDAKAAKRINLVDNRANDLAGWDEQLLAAQLGELPGVEGTGWSESELVSFMAKVNGPGEDTEPIEVPEEPRTKPGDLWLLGEHRLLCGDATVDTDVSRLMGGGVAEAMWTDPPYGVDYEGKTKRALKLDNDDAAGLPELLRGSFAAATGALVPGAPVYVAHPAGGQSLLFAQAFVAAGWRLHQTVIWAKNTIILGHSDYHFAHEPILYGWTPGPGRSGRGNHEGTRWYGDHSQSSLLAYDKPSASTEHPTAKPVGLVEQCVRNSSSPGDVVLDPFAGSGSTLIACENLKRRCYAMEIDPGYCDVIVDRFERHTGKKATRGD